MRLLWCFIFAFVTLTSAVGLMAVLIVGGCIYLSGQEEQKREEQFQRLLHGALISRIRFTVEEKSFELTDRDSLNYLSKRFQERKPKLVPGSVDYSLTAYLSTGEAIGCTITVDMPLKNREFLLVSPIWAGDQSNYRIQLTGDIPGPLAEILAEIDRAQRERKSKKG